MTKLLEYQAEKIFCLARVRYFNSINNYAYIESDVFQSILSAIAHLHTRIHDDKSIISIAALKEVFPRQFSLYGDLNDPEREKLVDLSQGSSWGIKSVNIGRDSMDFLWLKGNQIDRRRFSLIDREKRANRIKDTPELLSFTFPRFSIHLSFLVKKINIYVCV